MIPLTSVNTLQNGLSSSGAGQLELPALPDPDVGNNIVSAAGNEFYNYLQGSCDNFNTAKLDAVTLSADPGNISPTDVLKLQMDMNKSAADAELGSKVLGVVSNGVNTLTEKMQ